MPTSPLTRRSLLTRTAVAAVVLAGGAAGSVASGALAAGKPSLEILSPAANSTITSDAIDVQVKISNFTLDSSQAGRPDKDGVGHIHVMLDTGTMATLTGFYGSNAFSIPGDGLTPGKHTLLVALASNTHIGLMETTQMVAFDYQPAKPKPLPAANDQGEPGLTLVSPSDGSMVSSKFTVTVKAVNFTPSANLEGKPNVPGYGHYHVFVDTPMMGMGAMSTPDAGMTGTPMAGGQMAMMSMAGMVLMPGSDSFALDLSAWGPGKHTIWIEPVQNDHTMFEKFGHVEFTVNVRG
ncbi:MAG: hypothetical protein ACR2OO_07300 [Thermomicrobiales bacterium]